MSNPKQGLKRLVAAGAATALGVALVPMLAGTAQAATTDLSITAVTLAGPVRATLATPGVDSSFQTVVITVKNNAAVQYEVPAATTLSAGVTVPAAFVAPQNLSVNSVAGSLCYLDAAATIPAGGTSDITCQLELDEFSTAGTLVNSIAYIDEVAGAGAWGDPAYSGSLKQKAFSFTTTGAPTTFTTAPVSQTVPAAQTATYTVTAKDSAGRTTSLLPLEGVTITSAATTPASLSNTAFATGEATFTASAATPGPYAITVAPNLYTSTNFGSTGSNAILNVSGEVATGNPSVEVTSPTNAFALVPGYEVPITTTSVTYTLTGGLATDKGKAVAFTVAPSAGVTVTPSSGWAYLDGTTNTATVTVAVAGATAGSSINLTTTPVLAVAGTGAVTWALPTPSFAAVSPANGGINLSKFGGVVTASGIVTDQYGSPVPNLLANLSVTAGANAGVSVNALTGTDGSFSLSYTDTKASASSDTDTVKVSLPTLTQTVNKTFVTWTTKYTTTGSATVGNLVLGSLAVTPANFKSTVYVPFSGTANNVATGIANVSGVAGIYNVVPVTVIASVPGSPVTFTTTGGGYLGATSSTAWDKGKQTLTVGSNVAGQATAYFFSQKSGAQTVVAKGQNDTTDGQSATVTFSTSVNAARNVGIFDAAGNDISGKTIGIVPGTDLQVMAKVSDVFGNVITPADAAATNYTVDGFGLSANLNGGIQFTTGGQSVFVDDSTASADGSISLFLRAASGATSAGVLTVTGFGSQFGDKAGTITFDGTTNDVANAPASVKTVSTTVSVAGAPLVDIKSPVEGSAISSGGRFGVTAEAKNIAAGATAYLLLNGRSKAKTTVPADGIIRFDAKIPAQEGTYSIRIGGGSATEPVVTYSVNTFSLDIRLFAITRFNQPTAASSKFTFQIATGNWARGTLIKLTRNGIATASVRTGAVGQPVAISLKSLAPGTYQVRVDSNQGPVYGDANGQVVVTG